jgi:ribose-phosphate pyrophosphokinase
MSETLNLVNKSDSLSCDYQITKFPDGQQSITILEKGYYTYNSLKEQNTPIIIKSRLRNFKDLELIICANQALKEIGVKSVKLYIPYCIGGRSDRKFQEGGINYIKTVIAPIINSQNFDEVRIMDPHSDVLEACINNFVKINNNGLMLMALKSMLNEDNDVSNICLVSPDAGAYKKIFDAAKKFGIDKIITATKVRDIKTGKILHTEIPTLDQHNNLKYIIVDDICDGGRTFIELAKAIHGSRPTAEVYLVVTHGIFSNGLYELSKEITRIYSTNSVKEIEVDSYSDYTVSKEFLTQLNVF